MDPAKGLKPMTTMRVLPSVARDQHRALCRFRPRGISPGPARRPMPLRSACCAPASPRSEAGREPSAVLRVLDALADRHRRLVGRRIDPEHVALRTRFGDESGPESPGRRSRVCTAIRAELGIDARVGRKRRAHQFRLIGIGDHVQSALLRQFQRGVVVGGKGIPRIQAGFQDSRGPRANLEQWFPFPRPGASRAGACPAEPCRSSE